MSYFLDQILLPQKYDHPCHRVLKTRYMLSVVFLLFLPRRRSPETDDWSEELHSQQTSVMLFVVCMLSYKQHNWESHRFCVLPRSESHDLMALEEVLEVHSAINVVQKGFDARVSHVWLSCVC